MERIQALLEPYRHLDPLGWVGVYRQVPMPAGVALAAFGGLMLFFGGQRLFRLIAGPLGAAIGAVWAGPLAARLGFQPQANQIAIVATFAMLGVGFLMPHAVVFFAFGIPTGLLAGQLAGKADWMLGFVPGMMVGGAVGIVAYRPLAAVLSSASGAWLLVIGGMGALQRWVPAVAWLADNPVVALSIAACVALAGSSYQLFVRPSPETARARKLEKGLARKRAKEDAELEKRWSKYGKKA